MMEEKSTILKEGYSFSTNAALKRGGKIMADIINN
jgi:hypothetical protein